MTGGARFSRTLPYVVPAVAAGYLYYVASNFQFNERPGTLRPDFWPDAILALMIVTCLYKIVSGLVARNDAREIGVLEEIVEESVEGTSPEARPARRSSRAIPIC